MKYFYPLFISLSFFSTYSIAQSNYKAGLIVTPKGETVNGYINYKEWNYNPGSISYKKTLTDKAQTFGPLDISYFEVTGFETYKSAYVSVSMGKTELHSMKDEVDTSTVGKDVFLKLVKKGENVSLFLYADEVKTRYYITDNKSTENAQELIYRPYIDTKTLTVKSKNLYNIQLINLAKKYRPENFDILEDIVKTTYKEPELKKIISRINNEDPDQKENTLNSQPAIRVFAGLGINASNLKSSGSLPTGTTQSNKTFYYPKITIGVDAPFNPNVGRLVFRTELSFTIAKGEITLRSSDLVSATASVFKLDQQTISIKPHLIYNIYNTDSFKFYAGAGININYSHYPASVNKTSVVNDIPSLSYNREDRYESTTNFWFQFASRAGFTIGRKWDISANYFVPTRVSDAGAIPEMTVKGFDAGIGYYFGR